jgi:site-specific recombinase XerD
MMALEWSDLDLVKGQLCVARSEWKGHVTTTKGGQIRYVPLTERLAAALRAHRHLKGPRVLCADNGAPLSQREVQGLVARAARRANLRNVGVHVLRHTFCSHLAMRGASTRAIQELAGHQQITTTQRYMHLSPAAIDSAIRLLEPGYSVATASATIANSNNWKGKVGCGGGIWTLKSGSSNLLMTQDFWQ